jgi:hypothetical protein
MRRSRSSSSSASAPFATPPRAATATRRSKSVPQNTRILTIFHAMVLIDSTAFQGRFPGFWCFGYGPQSTLLLSLLFLLLLVEVSRAASGRQGLSGCRSKASFPHPDPGRSSPLRSAGAMPLRGRQQARESAPPSSGPSSEGSASEEEEVGEEVDGLDFNSFDFSGKHHPCASRRSMTLEN